VRRRHRHRDHAPGLQRATGPLAARLARLTLARLKAAEEDERWRKPLAPQLADSLSKRGSFPPHMVVLILGFLLDDPGPRHRGL